MVLKERSPWLVFAALMLGLSTILAVSGTTVARADDSQFFPLTGHSISGKFLEYWTNNGGLPVFGYPITDAQVETDSETGQAYLTQWFERNSFQLHPENAGTKYEVELGLLGKRLTANRIQNDPAFKPTKPAAGAYFEPATQHNIDSRFYTYWTNNGGLDRFGYPISEAQQETDPATGQTFFAQWFERVRMEYHPENPIAYVVELGLLGNEIQNSTPDMVLHLFYTAINNKTFQQAYNYWETPTKTLPAYDQWVAGYKNTFSVILSSGPYRIDVGAGNAYAPVPVVLVATQLDGSKQTYFGCYVTHRHNIIADMPWAILRGTIQQDSSGASVQALLLDAAKVCTTA